MGNSTIQLKTICDDAASLGDVSPALATGGFSDQPALSIANTVMKSMLLGGSRAQPFNWKWNRFLVPPFYTISFQQDYFIPGLVNLGWLENCFGANVNQTSIPKQKIPMEVRKDLNITYNQTGYLDKICWIQNNQCQTGTWGEPPFGPTTGNLSGQTTIIGTNFTGLQNPGPGVIYTNPIGLIQSVINATTCITDPNGNLWVLTTFGVCGFSEPSWPTNPVYPTYLNPTIVATTVADGTCVWTAINPFGQGMRLNPLPPQSGIVWLIYPIGQMRIPTLKSLQDTIEPIPDDWEDYFKEGFFCECYRRNPDPKVRARYPDEYKRWMQNLDNAVSQGSREMDDYGFFPSSAGVMDMSYGGSTISPAWPFGPS